MHHTAKISGCALATHSEDPQEMLLPATSTDLQLKSYIIAINTDST